MLSWIVHAARWRWAAEADSRHLTWRGASRGLPGKEQDRVGQWLRECCELEVTLPGRALAGWGRMTLPISRFRAADDGHGRPVPPLRGVVQSLQDSSRSAESVPAGELRRAAPRV